MFLFTVIFTGRTFSVILKVHNNCLALSFIEGTQLFFATKGLRNNALYLGTCLLTTKKSWHKLLKETLKFVEYFQR